MVDNGTVYPLVLTIQVLHTSSFGTRTLRCNLVSLLSLCHTICYSASLLPLTLIKIKRDKLVYHHNNMEKKKRY